MSEWDSLEPTEAEVKWLYGNLGLPETNGAHTEDFADALQVVELAQFVATEEVTSEPILGSKAETLLPADGMLLMYGDGGAGKTTLTIDAVFHLASGVPWLGLEVQTPVRTLLIENEGPRGKFRQVLGEKSEAWGAPTNDNVVVLEEPWTRFTLQSMEHRMQLAQVIAERDVDLVVMGPLVTLGMVGGGTPDEVSAFEKLIGETRNSCGRSFALWVVHHENKSGDVSGAWERVPDTLVHVQARGNGHTNLVWRKARWSSENHGKSADLMWAEGRTFDLVEDVNRDPWSEMLQAFVNQDEWRTAKEAGKLIHLSEAEAKKVLAELVRRGDMRFEKGPQGRSPTANCWRLEGARSDSAHLSAPEHFDSQESEVRGCAPPVRGAAPRSAPAPESATALTEPSAPEITSEDDIPF